MAKKEKQADKVLVTYKGFDSNLKCRGFQYEVGGTYKHDGEVEACSGGFHACEYPLDVFSYYTPADSRFAQVEQSGDISKHGDDSKVASGTIKISAEIGIPGLIKAAIEYTFKRALPIDKESPAYSDKTRGASSATGTRGASSATGDGGASSATGTRGASSATGDGGASSATGDGGASSATGTRGASSATGYGGASSATGYGGASSAMGKYSAAMAIGFYGKARGIEGSAIFLVYRASDGEILHAKAAIVGQDGILPELFYTLNENGEFVEADE